MSRFAAVCLVALLPAALFAQDDPEPKARAVQPREIVVEGLPVRGGRPPRPILLPTEKHLAEVIPDANVRAAILKKVDFEKEHLVLFSWIGSGGDRISPTKSKTGEACFEFESSVDKSKGFHAHLFAIPRGAKVKVTTTR